MVSWFGLFTSTPGLPWSLTDCSASEIESTAKFRAEILAAEPGSPIYVVHPFPKTPREVFEDFRSDFWSSWQVRERVPSEDLELADLLIRHDGTFQVFTVEDWSPLRCKAERASKLLYFLRIYAADGREVGRVGIQESGVIAFYQSGNVTREAPGAGKRWINAFVTLDEVKQDAARRFGKNAARLQYVTQYGTLLCPQTEPCVAFEDGSEKYLWRRHELFVLDAKGGPAVHLADFARPGSSRAALLSRYSGPQFLVSVGGDHYLPAKQVPPTSAKP